MNLNKKYSLGFGLLIISIIGIFSTFLILNKSKLTQNELIGTAYTISDKNEKDEKENVTTLYFVGDMMLDRGVEASVKKNFNNNFSALFLNLKELENADILFGNLEGPISDKGKNVGSKYSFRMDPIVIPILKKAGFDILSFANNHVGDWSVNAFKDTISRLNENGILKTGAGLNKNEVINPTIIKKNGITFGFLGFTDVGPNWMEAKVDTPGILLANDPDFSTIISNASKKCDILIISIHWGEEYKKTHNQRQETLAYKAVDAGANMVIGHHPHVIQDTEFYKGVPIIYSLGNFIFDQYFSTDTMKGMLFIASFEDKVLKETKQKEIILNRSYQPKGIFEIETKDKISEKSNCPKPARQYIDMSLYNIGKTNPLLDLSYIPDNLIPLDISISNEGLCLKEDIKDIFIKMKNDAEKENIFLKITSAFRSYDTQKTLYETKAKTSNNPGIYLAKPGYSEHQLGTAIDISGSSINYERATLKFENTIEDMWLRDNAYKYGFIQSYPKGKETITGYGYEPWHYRYIGIENAKYIKENNITIVEFLGSINKN